MTKKNIFKRIFRFVKVNDKIIRRQGDKVHESRKVFYNFDLTKEQIVTIKKALHDYEPNEVELYNLLCEAIPDNNENRD